jgi:hypothetical protein
MKLKLSINQRFTLSAVLAQQEGDSALLRILRKCREDFSLSEEEIKIIGYKKEIIGDDIKHRWDATKDPMKEIDLSDAIVGVLSTHFKKLDSEKKLKDNQLEYYEMFVEKK